VRNLRKTRAPQRLAAAALATMGLVAACSSERPPTGPTPFDPGPRGATAVVAAVGDIGWCGSPGVAQTARVIEGIDGRVLLAGDVAYPDGSIQNFIACFDPLWGQFRNRWHPVPGNHEYYTPGAAGYFQYFGAAAGPGRSYYQLVAGDWLVLMLDSNIDVAPGSPQFEFVRNELQRYRGRCTLAVWHHPLFSSGPNGDNRYMREMWRLLYDGNADVVVAGHDHLYERFGKQDADGRSDVRGLRQFIVGTGGAELYNFMRTAPNSQSRVGAFGALKLTLQPDGYEWAFVDGSGNVRDTGVDGCH
jgi:hypothetical protein